MDEDGLIELALDAGADDVLNAGEVFEVRTPANTFHKIRDAITARGFAVEASEITYVPANTVAIDVDRATTLLKLIDALDDNDDVQSVSHNAELPESVGA